MLIKSWLILFLELVGVELWALPRWWHLHTIELDRSQSFSILCRRKTKKTKITHGQAGSVSVEWQLQRMNDHWPGSVNWVEFSQRSATTQTIPYLLMNHWQIITFTQTSNEWPGWVMREFLPRSRYICPTLLLREISFPPRPHQPLQLHYGPAF